MWVQDRSCTVGITTVQVLEMNPYRRSCVFCNLGSDWIYLSYDANPGVSKGIPLAPNGLGTFEINAANRWDGAVWAIGAAAALTLTIHEVSGAY